MRQKWRGIGDIVRSRREVLKMTQEKLGRRSGVSWRTIAAIEAGSDLKASTLLRLAKTLKLSTDELLGRKSGKDDPCWCNGAAA